MSTKDIRPPFLASKILEKIIDSEILYGAMGDVEEQYRYNIRTHGVFLARITYWLQIAGAFPGYLKMIILWSLSMLKNNIIFAIRNLNKHKAYSFINVIGLSVGIAACLLILLFVHHELSFDRYHENAERIYRVATNGSIGANAFVVATTPSPMARTLVQDYPEVVQATRIYKEEAQFIRYKDKSFKEDKFLFADSTIFQVLSIPLVVGDPATVLNRPNTVVITPDMAFKYFGLEDPIGRVLIADDGLNYEVTGIVEPRPGYSHIRFDFLASFLSKHQSQDPVWIRFDGILTYILLQDGIEVETFSSKLAEVTRKYVGPLVEMAMGMSYDDFVKNGNDWKFFLQPLLDIHLHSNLDNELEPNGQLSTVIIFSSIAFIILLVACMNFINLATAQSSTRAMEVGIRKVMGSSRSQLVRQFLSEAIILSLIAVMFAIIAVGFTLPFFNQIIGREITFPALRIWAFIPISILVTFLVGLAAGAYPSFMMASFKPVTVLKSKILKSAKGRSF